MTEVVRTNFAPFSHVLKFFSRIGAPIIAPPSDDFSNLIHPLVWIYLPPKKAVNIVKICLEKKTLHLVKVIHYVTDTVELRKHDTKTTNTLSPLIYSDFSCT